MLPNWDLLKHMLAGNKMLVNQRSQLPRHEGPAHCPAGGAAQRILVGAGATNRGAVVDVNKPVARQLRNNDNNSNPQTPVTNTNPDQDLIIPNGVGLKVCVTACKNSHPVGTANGGLPVSDSGNPMCLAFHIVGRATADATTAPTPTDHPVPPREAASCTSAPPTVSPGSPPISNSVPSQPMGATA